MSLTQNFHNMDRRWRRQQKLMSNRRSSPYNIISPSVGASIAAARRTPLHHINTTCSGASCSGTCGSTRANVFSSRFLNKSNSSDRGDATEATEYAEPCCPEDKARRGPAGRLHTPSLMWVGNYFEGHIVDSSLSAGIPHADTAGGQSVVERSLQGIAGSEDEQSAWVEGINGFARILALSVTGDGKRRELLCDRKNPYAHFTPRKLCWTVVWSTTVAAVPIVNGVVLEAAKEELGGSGGGRSVTSDIFGVGAASRDETGSGWIVNRQGQLGWGQLPAVGRESDDDLEENDEDDLMLKLQRLLRRDLPWLAFRRAVHNILSVSTTRLIEWSAVMKCSLRTADRLTKNIRLSAERKVERMPRMMAAYKMSFTARRALMCQTLAIFLVDELFLICRLGWRERQRKKNNPYQLTDWSAILRMLRLESHANAKAALFMWAAGTVGAMAGTLILPSHTGSFMMITEQVVNAVLLP